jgi:hypothetical protein
LVFRGPELKINFARFALFPTTTLDFNMARGNFNDGESAYELDSQFDEDEQDVS